jgi:hypothetical protein
VLSTNVVISGTAPNLKFTATTSSSAFTIRDSDGTVRTRADLSGLAVLTAASAMNSGYQSVAGGGLTPYSATTDARYSADAITGKMTFVASNNAYNDTWLRTDGSNQMHASLQFDSPNPVNRGIIGASSIQNLVGQAIRIGTGSALTPVTGAGVIIGNGAEVLGDFRIRNTLQVDGNIWTAGSLGAAGNITGAGTLAVTGVVTAGSTLWAAGNIYAPMYVDSNDGNYYVDPAGTSRQNAVLANTSYASIFYDINNTGYYVQPSGTSRLNAVMSNAEYSGVFYDINNTGYYVQPSNVSRVNGIIANGIFTNGLVDYGSLEVGGFLQLDTVSTVGWGCAPNGLVSRDAWGGLLSCTNGAWASPGVTVSAPVTIVQTGPTFGNWSGCWGSPRAALITASGPGNISLSINGVRVAYAAGWGGEYSDVADDVSTSGFVSAGGTYCFSVNATTGMGRSSGINVTSTSM